MFCLSLWLLFHACENSGACAGPEIFGQREKAARVAALRARVLLLLLLDFVDVVQLPVRRHRHRHHRIESRVSREPCNTTNCESHKKVRIFGWFCFNSCFWFFMCPQFTLMQCISLQPKVTHYSYCWQILSLFLGMYWNTSRCFYALESSGSHPSFHVNFMFVLCFMFPRWYSIHRMQIQSLHHALLRLHTQLFAPVLFLGSTKLGFPNLKIIWSEMD